MFLLRVRNQIVTNKLQSVDTQGSGNVFKYIVNFFNQYMNRAMMLQLKSYR